MTDGLKSVFCPKCGRIIGRIAPGSRVQLQCRDCGRRSYLERPFTLDALREVRETSATSV